jgi:multiphosphoryl transfer protein
MVGLVLVSHSRPLAEAVGDFVRKTVSSNLALSCSGGVGENREELGTDAVHIQEAIASVYSEDGVLVLMDMGSAILSAETAKEFLSPEQQENVRLTSAPLVEGGIAAAIQAQIGSSLEEVTNAALQSLLPKREQIQDVAAAPQPVASAPPPPAGETLDVTILNTHGLHLRPAATLIKTLARFPAEILIENRTAQRGPVPVRSLVDVTRLQIRQGDSVRFSISASDSRPIVDAINLLVESRFGETPEEQPQEAPPSAPTTETIFAGSRWIAIGRPLLRDAVEFTIPQEKLETGADAEREIGHLKTAIEQATTEFDNRINRLRDTLQRQELAVFDAQRMILSDETIFHEVRDQVEAQYMNAAAAWHSILSRYATFQENVEDPYLRARAADFREVDRIVLSQLIDQKKAAPLPEQAIASPTIVICEELTPTLAEQFHRAAVAGVIQLGGGTTSHGAILARAFGLPAIGGARESLVRLRTAKFLAIDGSTGAIWIDPSSELVDQLTEKRRREVSEQETARRQSHERSITKDGVVVQVGANAGSANDIASARTNGAEFVGLFRSEFLFHDLDHQPDSEEQFAAFREALGPSEGSIPITIRLIDVGGDKPLPFLPQPKEANPFLGIRGIRLLMAHPRFFCAHLEAILRLAQTFTIRLMIPMVTDLSEVLATKSLLTEIAGDLVKAGVPHQWPIPVGAMIETPSAAVLIDQLLAHLDFVSIGTNDLTQYVLCAERGNASLSALSDPLHPAVVEVCKRVIRAAARHEVKASMCGEAASDPDAVPIWVGLGLRELSVVPAAIPGTKNHIRKLNASVLAAQLDTKSATFEGASDVRKFSQDFV